jgi:GT2 family glycosyltransferase
MIQKQKLTKETKVSIVIPVYNTKDLIKKNLPKVLLAKKTASNHIVEIIVVDNGSPDKSADIIKKEFPEIRLIRHSINRGFSAAVNTGARAASGNLLVLLNSDVIPEKDFLERIFSSFEDPNVFAVTLHENGYSWARGYFEDGFVGLGEGTGEKDIHESFWVNGGSGVYRRDYWMKLGGMDELLFSPFYWEDIDLSYRAAKRGLISIWNPNGKVEHHHESTVSQFDKRMVARIRERNQLIFIWKNITSQNLFRKHIIGLLSRIIKHPGYLRIVLMALLKIDIVLKARAKEKEESKISDEAIFAKFKNV